MGKATQKLSEGQVNRSAADIYEEFFVPALFEEWAPRVAKAAQLSPGQKVLDVACGTGVLAREALRSVSPGGAVTGLDRNDVMLTVARRVAPRIDWQFGRAESLPFADGSFDAVVSQFGLMFFEDRAGALKEMWRVLKPGGRLAVAVWGALDSSPGYADMAALVKRLFGDKIADELRAPYVLGDPKALGALFEAAGIPKVKIQTQPGNARFLSLESWVHTDVKGWTLADLIDDRQYQTLQAEAARDLKKHVKGDGTVSFAAPAHIATAVKGVISLNYHSFGQAGGGRVGVH
jgi:ubiquinone/menaquinone biosynthesis C-methylase UbiE